MTMLESYDPASGALVGAVPVTEPEDVPAAVERARSAQPSWQALGIGGRIERLAACGEIFADRAPTHAELISREMGKPMRESRAEAASLSHRMKDELAEIGEALRPETVRDGAVRSTILHDPLGVVAAITPWNFPMAMPSWMVLPALAAGNTVVFKPSEETPLCGQAYADVLNEILPDDVLVVVHGADEQGRALVRADVDMIAFTGSREVGKEILREASTSLKRVVLELGGKDPMIVLDDADIGAAAEFAAHASFRNAGQVCVSTERIFVLDSVADAFEEALAELTSALCPGPGLEDADVGPMVNARQRDHVLAQIDAAVSAGASVLARGGESSDNFVAPTVLTNVTDDMEIARAETFGPVACVTRVGSVDEAVERANATPFGLGAVVFGGDEDRAWGVAERLRAGMVGINRSVHGAFGTPWVGARESGFGFHKGRDGHRQFTQTRVLTRAS